MKVRHAQVENWMVEMVRRCLSDFEYRGKLDRQHYSFVKTAVVAPFPVYHHLIFCYNRTARRLQARVGCSLLPKWQLKRNPGRISHLSRMLSCDLSGHRRFVKSRTIFEGNIQDLLSVFLPARTHQLTTDDYLREALLELHREGDLSPKDYPPKLISDLNLVRKQHSLDDGESDVAKDENDALDQFLSEFVPKDSDVSTGAFSLNAEHASRKLQQFQLSSPQNFVVHLIGGAVSGGATRIDVYVDSDDIVVCFDGEPMGPGELADLEESLLHSEGSPRSRELNVALNAALSLDPRRLSIETWHGEAGWRLNFGRGDTPKSLTASPFQEASYQGHRVHFRDRPSFETVARFVRSLSAEHPELDVLRNRCGLAPVPILCQDNDLRQPPWTQAVSYLLLEDPKQPIGLEPPPGLPGLREQSKLGFSALVLLGPEPGLRFRINGVLYDPPERHRSFPLWCLVVDNRMARDLSYTGVKDGDELVALMAELGGGELRYLDFLSKRLAQEEGESKQTMARYLRDRWSQGHAKLAETSIFATIDDQYYSLNVLQQRNFVKYTGRKWKHPLRSGKTVFVLSADQISALEAQLADRCPKLSNADAQLTVSQIYFERREQWLAQKAHQKIEVSQPYGPIRSIPGMEGQFTLQRSMRACLVEPYAQNRPLPRVEVSDLPRGLLIASNWDELSVDTHWNHVQEDKAWEDLLHALRQRLDSFYNHLLSHDGLYTTHILHYLHWKKKRRLRWKTMISKLQFRLLDGSTRTWAELHDNDSRRTRLEGAWLRKMHLKKEQRRLMRELMI